MEQQVHKIARRSIVNGKWIRDSYDIIINGETHDFRDLAKQFGIEMPDAIESKKKINKDIQEHEDADMGSSHHSGDTEEHGDRDSESTE